MKIKKLIISLVTLSIIFTVVRPNFASASPYRLQEIKIYYSEEQNRCIKIDGKIECKDSKWLIERDSIKIASCVSDRVIDYYTLYPSKQNEQLLAISEVKTEKDHINGEIYRYQKLLPTSRLLSILKHRFKFFNLDYVQSSTINIFASLKNEQRESLETIFLGSINILPSWYDALKNFKPNFEYPKVEKFFTKPNNINTLLSSATESTESNDDFKLNADDPAKQEKLKSKSVKQNELAPNQFTVDDFFVIKSGNVVINGQNFKK